MTQPAQGSSPARYYIYDGELNGDGSLYHAYTWGADGPISERIPNGVSQSLWFVYDGQGATRALVDASGNYFAYTYTAYGQTVSAGSYPPPFAYGCQYGYYAPPGGFVVQCGARWYFPYLGCWLTRDPIGYSGGPNLYEYCGCDPVNGVDPSGLDGIDDAITSNLTFTGSIIGFLIGAGGGAGGGSVAGPGGTVAGAVEGGLHGAAWGAGGGYAISRPVIAFRHWVNNIWTSVSGGADDGCGPAKPKQPRTPNNMTNQEFGKLIGWGKDGRGAATRLKNVTPKDVKEMEAGGLTKDLAKAWADFYRAFKGYLGSAGDPYNTPLTRADLMDRIVHIWPKD